MADGPELNDTDVLVQVTAPVTPAVEVGAVVFMVTATVAVLEHPLEGSETFTV
jgi:hypothetical protein